MGDSAAGVPAEAVTAAVLLVVAAVLAAAAWRAPVAAADCRELALRELLDGRRYSVGVEALFGELLGRAG